MEFMTQRSAEDDDSEDVDAANCVTPIRPSRSRGAPDREGDEDSDEPVYVREIAGEASKRRKLSAIDAVSNNFDVHLFCEALQGGVEVIYCEKFNGDSPSQMVKLRMLLDEGNRVLVGLGVKAVAERADKRTTGENILVKNIDTYDGRVYNKLVVLRVVESTSKKTRKQAAVMIADLMNREIEKLIKGNDLKANQPKWRVKKSFDRTPTDPSKYRKLDEIVASMFAVKLVTEMYTETGPTWGVDNPEVASMFFSPPYANYTKEALFRGTV